VSFPAVASPNNQFLFLSSNQCHSLLLLPTIINPCSFLSTTNSCFFAPTSVIPCCFFQALSIPVASPQPPIPISFLQPVSIPVASPNHQFLITSSN
jgi:hypothetical protein